MLAHRTQFNNPPKDGIELAIEFHPAIELVAATQVNRKHYKIARFLSDCLGPLLGDIVLSWNSSGAHGRKKAL